MCVYRFHASRKSKAGAMHLPQHCKECSRLVLGEAKVAIKLWPTSYLPCFWYPLKEVSATWSKAQLLDVEEEKDANNL